MSVATNRGPYPVDEIDRFDPDIVHVHNLFPNFGRSWASRYSSRLVTTIHNYRPLCAAATLLPRARFSVEEWVALRGRGVTHATLAPTMMATLAWRRPR